MPLEIVSKTQWGAVDPEEVEELTTPVSYVVLKYNARVQQCKQFTECREYLRNLQKYTIYIQDRSDLDYNFYIGGDGYVYEGRGWKSLPLKEDDYNGKAIDICYMGMFGKDEDPTEQMVNTMRELIEYGIENDYIKKDYTLIDR